MTHCSLRYAPFHFPAKGSVITYFPSGVRLHGVLLGWTLLVGWRGGGGRGGTCSPQDQVEAAPTSSAVLETLWPRSSTTRWDSVMRQQLKARKLQKQKALSVSLSRLDLSHCIKQTAHKMIGLTFGPNLQPGEAFLKSDFLNVSVS